MSNFNLNTIAQIAQCTDMNDHGTALVVASTMLGYTRLVKVFTHIVNIADAEGGYDLKLMELRYSRYQELINLAQEDLTEEQYEQFYGAF